MDPTAAQPRATEPEDLLTIEKLVYGGEGLSRQEGRVVLTPYVLPGEQVRVRFQKGKSGPLRALPREIVQPHPQRTEPGCPYFTRCGGCHYQQGEYALQVQQKSAILRETLERIGKLRYEGEIQTITSHPWAYRNRVQVHFAEGELGFHAAGTHRLCPITHCPISSPKINETIAALRGMMGERRFPRFLRSLEIFTNESEVQLNVRETTQPLAKGFFDWCAERIEGFVPGSIEYSTSTDLFRISGRSFFQVNRFLADKLVDEALRDADGESAVELYAGAGLFTLPLARRFRHVTAVESGLGAAEDLRFNAERAGVSLELVHSPVESYLEQRTEPLDFVVADPPRAGLGEAATQHLLQLAPRQIRLVACDPSTLARDLKVLLAGGYQLQRLTLVDLFPQTYHIETAVHLGRE